jgi:hypothetical protein
MADFAVDVQRIDADASLPLWHAATHTCVFTYPAVLAAMAHDVHWWLATVSGRPASLWPVCVDAAGKVAPPEFAYYLGPFELAPVVSSPRRRLLRAVEIQHGLLDALTRSYERLSWSTLPGLHDVRPWLWFESNGRRPAVRPRYTAVLDHIDGLSDEQIRLRFGKERRLDLRRAMDAGVRLLPSPVSTDRVMELYATTMTGSGAAELGQRRLGEVEALCRLVAEGHGFIVACGLRGDDVARAIWLVLVAKGRACSVLSVADGAWRERDFNAFGRLCTIVAARDAGARCYDFNGANSLQRGPDKHSYGAEAELYFDFTA